MKKQDAIPKNDTQFFVVGKNKIIMYFQKAIFGRPIDRGNKFKYLCAYSECFRQ